VFLRDTPRGCNGESDNNDQISLRFEQRVQNGEDEQDGAMVWLVLARL